MNSHFAVMSVSPRDEPVESGPLCADDLRHRLDSLHLQRSASPQDASRTAATGEEPRVDASRNIEQHRLPAPFAGSDVGHRTPRPVDLQCLLVLPAAPGNFPNSATFRLERRGSPESDVFGLSVINFVGPIPWSEFCCPISRALRVTYGPHGTVARRNNRRIQRRQQHGGVRDAHGGRQSPRLLIDADGRREWCYSCVTQSGRCTAAEPCPI